MAVNVGGLLGGLVSGAGLYDQYQQLADVGQNYQAAVQPIISQAQENLQFKPYTVTSSIGGTQVSPEGQISLTPSQQIQGVQDTAFGGAQQLFGQALAPQEQRVQGIYDQIRALAAPQEQQQRLATEERLAAQGRLGLQSAQYGGSTPEMLAQEQAITQARNQAALSAMSQAQSEQLQSAKIGQSMLTSGLAPSTQMNNLQQTANQLAQIGLAPQTTLANIINNAGIGGLEASQAAEANRMNLLGQLYGVGAGLLGGTMNPITGEMQDGALTSGINNFAGQALNSLGGYFGNLLGGNEQSSLLPNYSTPITGGINNIDSSLANISGGLSVPTASSGGGYLSASDFMPSSLGNTSAIGTMNYSPSGANLFNL
jgi:hypothetical protein